MNLSKQINESYLDQNRDEIAFWNMIKDYAGRVANKWAPQDLLPEIVQDVMIQIFSSWEKFKPVDKSSFTRWICGITYRRSQNLIRDQFRAKEIPISQFGTWTDNEIFEPVDITLFDEEVSEELYIDALDRELKDDRIASSLDSFRGQISPKDHALFDLLRTGMTQVKAAKVLGISPATVLNRMNAWRKLAQSTKGQP